MAARRKRFDAARPKAFPRCVGFFIERIISMRMPVKERYALYGPLADINAIYPTVKATDPTAVKVSSESWDSATIGTNTLTAATAGKQAGSSAVSLIDTASGSTL